MGGDYTPQIITGVRYDLVVEDDLVSVVTTGGWIDSATPEWTLPILTDDPAERLAAIADGVEALQTYEGLS